MFSSVDIQDELLKARQKHAGNVHALMQQVEESKKKGLAADEFILKRLRNAAKPGRLQINNEALDKNKVFSQDDIKSVCILYRLRFLESKYFKMEGLPQEATAAIKDLEKELGGNVGKIKILASPKFFKPGNVKEELLLFTGLDENNYYLVSKWGNSFSWYKKWLAYPLRSIWALLSVLIIIGLPGSFIVPAILFHTPELVQYYQMFYLAAVTITALFTTVFGGFTFHRSFSRACWNSPYFN